MRGKQKPAARGRKRASGVVLAGERDSRKIIRPRTEKQALTERELFDGRTYLGTVRETTSGEFVAVAGENVLGVFRTCREATDVILDLARLRAAP
jgi:hypothetical protein